MAVTITSFYFFNNLTPAEIQEKTQILKNLAEEEGLKGLVLLGVEGFNLTVSGSPEGIRKFKNLFLETWGYQDFLIKDSLAPKHPFKHFRVQERAEIVTLGVDGIQVPAGKNAHLTPSEWQAKLDSNEAILIDTRNWYETDIGKFKNALDFRIKEFSEFPSALKNANLPKDKEVLIYCTGGIRCEKAIEEMKLQGFDKVHQLEGGILNYIENYPNRDFEGECFVFDHRVAVDQELKPSQIYRLCPHCGQPGTQKIACLRCDHEAMICSKCSELEYNLTCSKNCAHHYRVRPGVKGPHQEESVYYVKENS